jgi:phenylpropionate dioxygenase-like ring-hydroxylating dioxygenase large terminal subunit
VFPVVERYNLVWIWLGKLELSDPTQIPDVHWMDDSKWVPSTGYHYIEADYRLITDNLLDLSHETYVHKETIGNEAVADAPVQVKLDRNRIIRAHREMPNIEPPPLFAQMLNHWGKINRWQIAIYMPPGIAAMRPAFYWASTRPDSRLYRSGGAISGHEGDAGGT